MKNRTIIALCMTLLITAFTGCSNSPANSHSGNSTQTSSAESKKPQKQVPDLKGEWKQINSTSKSSYQAATISGKTIEIFWVSDNGDTKSLYWAGTFVAPTSANEPYQWKSKNDHSKTEKAMLASTADTKAITYQNGMLSYQASALGTTTTVKLQKQK